jgi:opacity protein-like surface antigen
MIGSRKPLVLAAVGMLCATLGTASAFAQEPPPASPPPVGGSLGVFGERGQFVVSSDLDLRLTHSSTTKGFASTTGVTLTPSLDYFVSPNFSVGALISIDYASLGDDAQTTISVGARAGYNVVLTNVLTLWIRGGLAYAHLSTDPEMGDGQSGNSLSLQVFAPLLWHPAPHFFIGAGPAFETDLIAKFDGMDTGKTTSIGILSTVGGYWGGL